MNLYIPENLCKAFEITGKKCSYRYLKSLDTLYVPFPEITSEQFKKLNKKNLINKYIEDCPHGLSDFLKFLNKNKKFYAIGYYTSGDIGLNKICLTGILYKGIYTKKELIEFTKFVKGSYNILVESKKLKVTW